MKKMEIIEAIKKEGNVKTITSQQCCRRGQFSDDKFIKDTTVCIFDNDVVIAIFSVENIAGEICVDSVVITTEFDCKRINPADIDDVMQHII